MSKTNKSEDPVLTHEGAKAQKVSPYAELKRTLLTCLLWEDTFYEKGSSIASRIASLVPKVSPEKVAALAIEAREGMQLRHAPLFLLCELSKVKGAGAVVREALVRVIQRADELSEFMAIYWKEGKHPLSAGVKRGLAKAFQKFDAYDLAKYDQSKAKVKLRDVLFLVHATPKDKEQADTWKKLVDNTLESPDTWEVALSAGKDKKETWERLLREGKLGGLAVLRNLRNMLSVGVDEKLITERLEKGARRALPFRFIAAAKYASRLEPAIEKAMFKAAEDLGVFPGKTAILIDVSGSMDGNISSKSDMTRLSAASALAILLREKSDSPYVGTFSEKFVEVAPRRGFALRDLIYNSQHHAGTYTAKALVEALKIWATADRIIVITDEQSHQSIPACGWQHGYVVNVAPYQHGISYGNGWTHIDGWSERVLDYIMAVEREEEEK